MFKQFCGMLVAAVLTAAAVPVFPVSAGEQVTEEVQPTITASGYYLFQEIQEDSTYLLGWNDSNIGSYSCEKQPDGSFTAEWSGVNDCETYSGWFYKEPIPMSEHYDVSYEIEAEGEGYCYFGVSGWLENPQRQFYILDGWNGSDPFEGKVPRATLEINGAKYDLYAFYRKEPDFGPVTPPEFWSIRQENLFQEGEKSTMTATVSLDEHLRAWEDLGYLTAGDYQLVAAYVWVSDYDAKNRASGSCTIKKPEIVTGEPAGFEAKVQVGDANCDEVIDVSDAVLTARFCSGDCEAVITDQGKQNADMNKDSNIDLADVTAILRKIVKLD